MGGGSVTNAYSNPDDFHYLHLSILVYLRYSQKRNKTTDNKHKTNIKDMDTFVDVFFCIFLKKNLFSAYEYTITVFR